MIGGNGIEGPDEVEEGSGDITVNAPGSTKLTVTVSTTGVRVEVPVGPDGRATFPLPPGTRAGATLLITDSNDRRISTEIRVVPGTG